MLSQNSTGASSSRARETSPALLTRTSTPPWDSTANWTTRRHAVTSRRSPATEIASCPAARQPLGDVTRLPRIEAVNHHLRAQCGEMLRDGPPNAGARARHDRNFVCQGRQREASSSNPNNQIPNPKRVSRSGGVKVVRDAQIVRIFIQLLRTSRLGVGSWELGVDTNHREAFGSSTDLITRRSCIASKASRQF